MRKGFLLGAAVVLTEIRREMEEKYLEESKKKSLHFANWMVKYMLDLGFLAKRQIMKRAIVAIAVWRIRNER